MCSTQGWVGWTEGELPPAVPLEAIETLEQNKDREQRS